MAGKKVEETKKEEVKEEVKDTAKKKTAKKVSTEKKEDTGKKGNAEKEEAVREKARKIDMNELICVRSVTKGGLTYISTKTGTVVKWADYGVEEYVEFGELLTMRASKPRFLNDPFIVIDDEVVAEKLGLTKMYNDMVDIDNLESFYTQTLEKMKEQLDKMPQGIKRLIIDKSRELIETGKLYDIRKIKLLEDKLQIDLQILMD